jgi:hypothetical protein
MHIDRLYARLRLGLVDATVVALAEELGIVRLATRGRHSPHTERNRSRPDELVRIWFAVLHQ